MLQPQGMIFKPLETGLMTRSAKYIGRVFNTGAILAIGCWIANKTKPNVEMQKTREAIVENVLGTTPLLLPHDGDSLVDEKNGHHYQPHQL